MLKRASMLVPLCAMCIWAADFWITKPFTEWSDKEVEKIISSSPWSGKITMSAGGGGGGGLGIAETAGGGGGRGGGGRGGGRSSGPQGDAANSDPGTAGGGGGDFGGGGSSGVTVTMFWQTAAPIKQALIKRQYGAEAGTSPEAKAKLDRADQVYVLTMLGVPRFALASAQGDKKAALLDSTVLSVNGKPVLKAADVQVSGGGGSSYVSFLFPRSRVFAVEDKEVEFSSKFGTATVKHKFKLKDMVFNGKVEM